MAKKKTEEKTVHRPADPNVMGLRGAVVEDRKSVGRERVSCRV